MELTVRRTELLRELQLFQGIVERKNTIPILANVLVEADDGADVVQLAATDLEVGLRSRCAATVTTGGSLTLPAKKLYEIVRALPDTDVRIIQSEAGTVTVDAANFNSRMQALPRDDFPTIPEPAGTHPKSLPGTPLREMIAKTQFAITGEDTRFFLNGALLLLTDDTMRMVATDGHRLALASAPRESVAEGEVGGVVPVNEGSDEGKAILPKKTLWELARLLDDNPGDVTHEHSENHLFFDVGGRQLVSRKIDAQFPAYERVIPTENDKRIEFERDRLTQAIRRVALLSSERSHAIKIHIDAGKVEISSSSPEHGAASETLSVEFEGQALDISFNAQYLIDFLGVANSDSVALEFKDGLSQAVLSPVGADGCDYTYVIMPMRS